MKFDPTQFLGANFGYVRHTLDYFINAMFRRNIHNIEFYSVAPHLCLGDCSLQDAHAVWEQLSHADISVRCFTPEHCNYPISLASSDDGTRRRSLRYYEEGLNCAYELGAPLMQIISGYGLKEDTYGDNLKRAIDALAYITDIASKLGIIVVLEADPNCVIHNTNDQLNAIQTVDSPFLTGMIDTNAIALNNEDLKEALSLLGNHVRHLHFIDLDIKRGSYCLVPGEGNLPMIEFFNIFADYKYPYGITPEFWGNTYLNEADESLDRAFAFFSTYNQ